MLTVSVTNINTNELKNFYFSVNEENIKISIIGSNLTASGLNFTVLCVVSVTEGISNLPQPSWLHIDQNSSADSRVTIEEEYYPLNRTVVLALSYTPILESDGPLLICQANLTSPAPPFRIEKTNQKNVTIRRM